MTAVEQTPIVELLRAVTDPESPELRTAWSELLRRDAELVRLGGEVERLTHELEDAQVGGVTLKPSLVARADAAEAVATSYWQALRDAQAIIEDYADGGLDPLVALGKIGHRLLAVESADAGAGS